MWEDGSEPCLLCSGILNGCWKQTILQALGDEKKVDESETEVTEELVDDGDISEKETEEIEKVTGEEQPEGEAEEAKEQPIVPTEVEETTVEIEEGEVAETPKDDDIFLGTDLSE